MSPMRSLLKSFIFRAQAGHLLVWVCFVSQHLTMKQWSKIQITENSQIETGIFGNFIKFTDFKKKKERSPVTIYISSWWLQPIWKICSSNWKRSPIFGVKIKNMWVATTIYIYIYLYIHQSLQKKIEFWTRNWNSCGRGSPGASVENHREASENTLRIVEGRYNNIYIYTYIRIHS